MAPAAQVPDVQLVTIAALQEYLGVEPALDHIRRAPLAGDHGVVAQVPPEVVGEVLRSPLYLPSPQGVETLVIHDEDAAGTLPVGSTERAHVDTLRAAVDGVGAAVAGSLVQLVWLYHLDYARLSRVGLGVDDVHARRAQTRDDQIPALYVRVGCVGAKRRAAGVPAEVVQLIAGSRHLHAPDDLTVSLRARIGIEDSERVRAPVTVAVQGCARVQDRHIGKLLSRRMHRHARRGVETWVGSPDRH